MPLFGSQGLWQGQDRLSPEARRALNRAEIASLVCGQRQITPDALLLALLDAEDRDGVAQRALDAMGLHPQELVEVVRVELPRAEVAIVGRATPDAATREAIVLGLNEARRALLNQAGSGHLLLGLLEARSGRGVRYLRRQGADLKTLRALIDDLERQSAESDPQALFATPFTALLHTVGGAVNCPTCNATLHQSFHYCYNCGAVVDRDTD